MRYGSTAIRVRVRFDKELTGEAICWNGQNVLEVKEFLGYIDQDDAGRLIILTSDGAKKVVEGDWLVKLDEAPGIVAPIVESMLQMIFEPTSV